MGNFNEILVFKKKTVTYGHVIAFTIFQAHKSKSIAVFNMILHVSVFWLLQIQY